MVVAAQVVVSTMCLRVDDGTSGGSNEMLGLRIGILVRRVGDGRRFVGRVSVAVVMQGSRFWSSQVCPACQLRNEPTSHKRMNRRGESQLHPRGAGILTMT